MGKLTKQSIMMTLVLTVLFGLVYPLVMTGLARVLFPHQANGSLIVDKSGTVIGSELIGQNFTSPGYFHPRPSAAGNGYDAANSGGTNLGPLSAKLLHGVVDKANPSNNFDGVEQLAAAVRQENHLAPTAPVPVDAVTRSASGLDPDISPAYAELQVPRVATRRGLSPDQVREVVRGATRGRQLWVLGEPRVNVLEANLKLDELAPGKAGK
jgi:K+-transporting ATPase ATPase C chain